MAIAQNEFLKALTVKEELIKIDNLNGKEVLVKERTVAEDEKIEKIRQEVQEQKAPMKKLIIESCRLAMVEPKCPSDDELNNMSEKGFAVFTEIYMRLPTIGLDEKAKKVYEENLINQLKTEAKKFSEEDLEKK